MPKKHTPTFVIKVEGHGQKVLRTTQWEDHARDEAREISRRLDEDVVIEVRTRVPRYAAGTKRKLADQLVIVCTYRDGRLVSENHVPLMAGTQPG